MERKRLFFLRKMVVWQLVPTVIVATIFMMVSGKMAAIACFSGGLIGVALNVLVFVVSLGGDELTPEQSLKRMFRGAALKFMLAVVLFGLAVYVLPHQFLAILTGFCTTLIVYWVALGKNWA